MRIIGAFKHGRLDAVDIYNFRKKVNTHIGEYNKLDSDENNQANRIAILEKIQASIKKIDYKFTPDEIANSEKYLQIRATLLKQIQDQYASMGKTITGKPVNSLSEIITGMPSCFR